MKKFSLFFLLAILAIAFVSAASAANVEAVEKDVKGALRADSGTSEEEGDVSAESKDSYDGETKYESASDRALQQEKDSEGSVTAGSASVRAPESKLATSRKNLPTSVKSFNLLCNFSSRYRRCWKYNRYLSHIRWYTRSGYCYARMQVYSRYVCITPNYYNHCCAYVRAYAH